MSEPAITINGVPLSTGQAMTVRVACVTMQAEMQDDPMALGDDEQGMALVEAYTARLSEVLAFMHKGCATVDPKLSTEPVSKLPASD